AASAGEQEIAEEAMAGLEPEGDTADAAILVARGNLAFFSGDVESAWEIANEGGAQVRSPDDPMAFVNLLTLQGLVAHSRGEWFERFRMELRRARGRQRL